MNQKKIIGKGLYKFIVAKGGWGVGGGRDFWAMHSKSQSRRIKRRDLTVGVAESFPTAVGGRPAAVKLPRANVPRLHHRAIEREKKSVARGSVGLHGECWCPQPFCTHYV
jgi:hypothetical protein